MDGELYFEGKKYISSSRAAKLSGYANDYIGQLCRGGKIDSRMVGRSWYVSVDSLFLHKQLNATAKKKRRKKLSQEVIDDLQEKGFLAGVNKRDDLRLGEDVSEIEDESIVISSIPIPVSKHICKVGDIPEKKSPLFLNFGLSVVSLAVFVLIFTTFLSINGTSFMSSIHKVVLVNENIAESTRPLPGSFFERVAVKTYRTINKLAFKTTNVYKVFSFKTSPVDYPEVTISDTSSFEEPKERPIDRGLVVVPADEDEVSNKEMVASIKNSFSDEVVIKPDTDGESGVITPVFRTRTGDDYLYVLVPIKN